MGKRGVYHRDSGRDKAVRHYSRFYFFVSRALPFCRKLSHHRSRFVARFHSTCGNKSCVAVILWVTLVPLDTRISSGKIRFWVATQRGDPCRDQHDSKWSSALLPPPSEGTDLIMLRPVLYFALLALALVVVGMSSAILRSMHHSIVFYVLAIPIWFSLLVVLVSVARVTRRGTSSGNGQ